MTPPLNFSEWMGAHTAIRDPATVAAAYRVVMAFVGEVNARAAATAIVNANAYQAHGQAMERMLACWHRAPESDRSE